jgi:hypothetical protein
MIRHVLFTVFLGIALLLSEQANASSVLLTDAQRARLAILVHTDSEAHAQFAPIRDAADDALRAHPDPIPLIQTEGKLAGDPVKTRTWESLNDDMPRLQSLAYAWAVTADQRYANKIRQFVVAWAVTNHSAGDPIDDTNLEPLIIAYDLIRQNLSTSDRDVIDRYLRGIAAAEIKTGIGPVHTNVNNWNSHRVKLVGLIAFTLEDRALIDQTVESYQRQIWENILPDGSSIDFHERDALHYHLYDIQPLLTLAIAARNNRYDFYDYRSPTGSSLSGAVAFLLQFANGSRIHIEFANSTVPFDRQRAANGEGEYKPHPWDPHGAPPILELAEQFDPSLLPLIKKLDRSNAQRFPSWQIVLNSVR